MFIGAIFGFMIFTFTPHGAARLLLSFGTARNAMLTTTAQLSAWQRCFWLSHGSLRSVWVGVLGLTYILNLLIPNESNYQMT